MQQSIFRKVSLDRLSSPEQLDTLLRITRPHAWLALVALAVLLGVGLFWSVTARLPIEMSAPALLVQSDVTDQPDALEARLFLPVADSRSLAVGMPVTLVIDGYAVETLNGSISAISQFPVNLAEIGRNIPDPSLLSNLTTDSRPIEVQVTIDQPSDSLHAGLLGNATVKIGVQRPIDLVIPLQ